MNPNEIPPPPHPSQFPTQQAYLTAYQIWQQAYLQARREQHNGGMVFLLLFFFLFLPMIVAAILAVAGAFQ